MAPEVYCNAYFGVTVVVQKQYQRVDSFHQVDHVEMVVLISKVEKQEDKKSLKTKGFQDSTRVQRSPGTLYWYPLTTVLTSGKMTYPDHPCINEALYIKCSEPIWAVREYLAPYGVEI